MASRVGPTHHPQRDAFGEAGGWRGAVGSAFRSDGPWKLIKRLGRPHLYRPSAYLYETREPFTSVDGMERIKHGETKPYECTINPDDGKFERLLVQAPMDICNAANSTWNRTVVRNVSPLYLRVANLPFKAVHRSQRTHGAEYDGGDWIKIVCLWPLATVGILLYPFASVFERSQPLSKDINSYLPFHYKGYKYPVLAKNYRENRDTAALERLYDSRWLSSGVSYRPLRPRYLCFLNKKGPGFNVRAVKATEDVSYVFIAYTTEQFDCAPLAGNKASDDLKTLCALALMATRQREKTAESRKERPPDAFWLAHQCTPHDRYANDEGEETPIDHRNQYLVQKLKNEDTYSISDVIRMAEHVIVIAGNPARDNSNGKGGVLTREQANKAAIKEWGSRAWTLPEILLSRGDSVTVCYAPQKPLQLRSTPKQLFPTLAWGDGSVSRQLVDHFSTLHLSRLELVNIAWECLMGRSVDMHKRFAGDLSYILMGLLRLRPPVDTTDSPFQAFGRLSLPQDSDRLMERLILLLPEKKQVRELHAPVSVQERPWEEMTDQFDARLWDIYPDTQICGIGEADTVVVDGFRGALIQWDKLHPVRTATRLTLKRRLIMAASKYSFPLLVIGIILALIPKTKLGGIIIVCLSFVFPLLAPILIPRLYDGKLWGVEPCLFGIEGYIPLAEIERRLFGARLRGERLRWSPNFSPLSRHGPSPAGRERLQKYYDDEGLLLDAPVDDWRNTDLVQGKDPLLCDSCEKAGGPGVCPKGDHPTYDEIRRRGQGLLGELKVFTLIDTLSMTVTLFEARRPPIVLLVGGSEGGMKRALACSYDMETGVLHRETILRIPTASVDYMHSVARVRLGLERRFNNVAPRPGVRQGPTPSPGPGQDTTPATATAAASTVPARPATPLVPTPSLGPGQDTAPATATATTAAPTVPARPATPQPTIQPMPNIGLPDQAGVRADASRNPQTVPQERQPQGRQHPPSVPAAAARPSLASPASQALSQTSTLVAGRSSVGSGQAVSVFPVAPDSRYHQMAPTHQSTEPSPPPAVFEAVQMDPEPRYYGVPTQNPQASLSGSQIDQQQHYPFQAETVPQASLSGSQIDQQQHHHFQAETGPQASFSGSQARQQQQYLFQPETRRLDVNTAARVAHPTAQARPNFQGPASRQTDAPVPPSAPSVISEPSTVPFTIEMQPLAQQRPTAETGPNYPLLPGYNINPNTDPNLPQPQQYHRDYHFHQHHHYQHQQPQPLTQYPHPQQDPRITYPPPSTNPPSSPSNAPPYRDGPARGASPTDSAGPSSAAEEGRPGRKYLQKRVPPASRSGAATATVSRGARGRGAGVGGGQASTPWENASLGSGSAGGGSSEWTMPQDEGGQDDSGAQGGRGWRKRLVKRKEKEHRDQGG